MRLSMQPFQTQAGTSAGAELPLPLDPLSWQTTHADSIAHAAAIVAAELGSGMQLVYVADPTLRLTHGNGAPMVCHRFELWVGLPAPDPAKERRPLRVEDLPAPAGEAILAGYELWFDPISCKVYGSMPSTVLSNGVARAAADFEPRSTILPRSVLRGGA